MTWTWLSFSLLVHPNDTSTSLVPDSDGKVETISTFELVAVVLVHIHKQQLCHHTLIICFRGTCLHALFFVWDAKTSQLLTNYPPQSCRMLKLDNGIILYSIQLTGYHRPTHFLMPILSRRWRVENTSTNVFPVSMTVQKVILVFTDYNKTQSGFTTITKNVVHYNVGGCWYMAYA